MHWEFVVAGYGFVGIVGVVFTLWTLRQGRSLSRQVPAERRRFLD
ncbi:MAG: hypothetical protein AAGD35_17300 [Actinomycetota bacterium]